MRIRKETIENALWVQEKARYKWIDCKDDLPDLNIPVIVAFDSKYYIIYPYIAWRTREDCWQCCSTTGIEEYPLEDITHWLPLPIVPYSK